jgi:hypothetical protein
MQHTPTPEQQAIIDAARSARTSLMIRAYAGCSKTTVLEMCSRSAIAEPHLYIVFNTKNRKEAEGRFPSHCTVKTINSIGHSAWGRAIGKTLGKPDDRKQGKAVTAVFKEAGFQATTEQWSACKGIVTLAMQCGLVPREFHPRSLVPDTDDTWRDLATEAVANGDSAVLVEFARKALVLSIKQSFEGNISFDDQIYMSVCFNGVFPRFSTVMVDEAQDQSVLNIEMIRRCCADRLIVVGDQMQACYAFRGAAGDALDLLRALRQEWIDLPLATTFRCPKRIVSRSATHAIGFIAWHANAEGEHLAWPTNDQIEDHCGWNASDVARCAEGGTVAVLCRNNAPLLGLAFKLLAARVPVVMLGRDIGKGLTALAKKLLPDNALGAPECARRINEWADREAALAEANDKPSQAESVRDRAECLLAVLNGGAAYAGDLIAMLTDLFARDSGRVTLSSIHRAKGLEWDTVLHLDPWRIPSKWARGVQLVQERNLKYICETRTKHTLIEASLEDFAA